jgi:hypothetical protein
VSEVGEDFDDATVRPGEVGEIPGAREIRRFTTQAANARGGANLGSLLTSVYYTVITLGIAIGLALGFTQAMRESLPTKPAVTPSTNLSLATLVVVIIVALVGALVSLAGRLGPVGAGGAEAAWWLPLPVERRALLRPAARRLPMLAALVAAILVGLLDAGLVGDSPLRVTHVVITSALVGAGIVLLAALVQSAGVRRSTTALAGDLILVIAPVAALGLALTDWSVEEVPTLPWYGAAVAGVVLVVVAVLVDRRLGHIPTRSLRESGSVATQAVGAAVSLDSRELGRALTDGAASTTRRFVSRLRTARGPASALVTADLVVLRRSVRHVVQLIVAGLVPVLVSSVPELASTPGILLSLLVSGYVAMSATGEGARRAQMAPVLDRLLPLEAKVTRQLRMVVPAAAMLAWSVVAFTAVGRWAGDVAGWVVLGVVSTPVWAAAAVRSSYRPTPDWGGPLVSTPMGALPTGVGAVLARGPDLVILGLLPVWIAVLVRQVNPMMIGIQVTLTLVALAIASSIATGTLLERMLESQAELENKRELEKKQARE